MTISKKKRKSTSTSTTKSPKSGKVPTKSRRNITTFFVQNSTTAKLANAVNVLQIQPEEVTLHHWQHRNRQLQALPSHSVLLPPDVRVKDAVFWNNMWILLDDGTNKIHLYHRNDVRGTSVSEKSQNNQGQWKTMTNTNRILKMVVVSPVLCLGINDRGCIYNIQATNFQSKLVDLTLQEIATIFTSKLDDQKVITQCYAYTNENINGRHDSVTLALVLSHDDNEVVPASDSMMNNIVLEDGSSIDIRMIHVNALPIDVDDVAVVPFTKCKSSSKLLSFTNNHVLFSHYGDKLAILLSKNELLVLTSGNAAAVGEIKRYKLPLSESSGSIQQIALVSATSLVYSDVNGVLHVYHLNYNYITNNHTSTKGVKEIQSLGSGNYVLVSSEEDDGNNDNEQKLSAQSFPDPSLTDILNKQQEEKEQPIHVNDAPLKYLKCLIKKSKSRSVVEYPIQEKDLSEHEIVQELRNFLIRSPSIEGLVYGAKSIIMRQNHVNSQLLCRALANIFHQLPELELLLVTLSKLLGGEVDTSKAAILWISCAVDAHYFMLVEAENSLAKDIVQKAVAEEIRISQAFIGLEDLLLLFQQTANDSGINKIYHRLSGYSIERITF